MAKHLVELVVLALTTLWWAPTGLLSPVAELTIPLKEELRQLQQLGGLGGPVECLLLHCSVPMADCVLHTLCRKAAICNSECYNKTNSASCNLLCELNYGYNSTQYRTLVQCMSDHGCLPKTPSDGKCLAQDTDTLKNLTNLSQVKGKWWILRGLNCGQSGWPAGFDFFPCQRDEFVYEGAHWVDHIAYCGGRNNTCSTPLLYTLANVSIWCNDTPVHRPPTETAGRGMEGPLLAPS